MLAIVCSVVGCILAIMSRLALIILQKNAFLFLPCVLLAIRIGFMVEGGFVVAYLGPAAVYAAYFALCLFLVKKAKQRNPLVAGGVSGIASKEGLTRP